MRYSEPQLRAIHHLDGPMIVLAGPGSGKTAVITGRTDWLIREAGVPAGNILVITFTRAAAEEMRSRFLAMQEPAPADEDVLQGRNIPRTAVRFGTFHSVFFQILRLSYGYGPERILQEETANQILRELIHTLSLEDTDERDVIRNLKAEISAVKESGTPIESYYSLSCPAEKFRDIFRDYHRRLAELGKMDFDDILLATRELLLARKDILASWQQKYRYILVDEFQDINALQYEIIRMLAEPMNNLFVVGDDDQSIYRFRGARPEIMLRFPKDYRGAEQVVLNENYRSSPEIVLFADRVIMRNTKRYRKNIEAMGETGPAPVIRSFPERKAENEAIVDDIRKAHAAGTPYEEMAVLFRTNLAARSISEKLTEYNIPIELREGLPSLYDHWIARDVMTYLAVAAGERGRAEFLRIMNRPNRYLSRESLAEALVDLPDRKNVVSFVRWKDFYQDKGWMIARIHEFQTDLAAMSTLHPYAAMHYLRNVVGYEQYLRDYAKERGMDADELIQILMELQENAKPFRSLAEWQEHIAKITEELNQRQREKQEHAVMIATMHGAKGLEFDRVYIPDVVDGMIPYQKALKLEDIEEERRLFYVGVTRARRHLWISTVETLYGKTKEISPFLEGLVPNKGGVSG